MTTTVTVTTHSWPAEVQAFPLNNRVPLEDGDYTVVGRVEPNSAGSFVVHSGQDLLVRELPSANEEAPASSD
jgi:hypothetical protein